MNSTQAKAFMDAIEAAEIKTFEFDTDLCTHLYNDGIHAIVKCDYDKECCVAIRSVDYGGSHARYENKVQVVMSDFGDIHEVRAAGTYDQIIKFIDSYGGITLTDDDLKVILHIDKANYDIIPANGDYVNAFKYLSAKDYEALSEEEKAKYDAEKKKYEERNLVPGKNQAARITL